MESTLVVVLEHFQLGILRHLFSAYFHMKLPLLQVINPDKVCTCSRLLKAVNMFTISSFTKEH